MAIPSIYSLVETVTPFPHCLRQRLKDLLGIFPANACIGDADSVLKARFAFLWHLLRAYTRSALATFIRRDKTHLH